jgi:filamentous hemagglutinin
MNLLRLAIQWSTFNRASSNLNKSVYAAKRSFASHHSYFSLLQPCRKHQKYIAQIILASYFSMPGVLLAQGVSAAANSANAPSFDTSANGIPIVNINAPSRKGVSRNEYNKLNVGTKGLIFNNATDIVNTQLAGYIDGNSKLNGNSATIILNEVKGNSRSALNGYMEIAGRSAELIIANQNGITCNGCGFINTTRGTLTTGLPTFDGSGGLTGFDVSKGDVDISGLGLNASNVDEVDILARSVSLNSKFWAKNATIVTGQNHINYQDKKVQDKKDTTALGSSGSGVSLDVAAIGGMYANRIRLIGTEKGLGVNVAGEIKAVEDMTLDNQGNLINSGSISAKTLAVSSKGINNTGSVLGNTISIDADLLDNNTSTANIQAVNSVSIKLKDELTNRDGAKVLASNGQLKINADAVVNKSSMAANQLSIIASQLDNNTENASLYAIDKVDLTLTGQLNNTSNALIQSDNQLIINANGDLTNSNAIIASLGSTALNSQNLSNSGTILSQNDTLTIRTQQLDNRDFLGGENLDIQIGLLNNTASTSQIYANNNLDLIATGDINNSNSALIHGGNELVLSASGDIVNSNATIESANNSTLTSRNLSNSANSTILAQNGALTINTGTIDNDGTLKGNNIDAIATVINNQKSTSNIAATGDLTLKSTQGNINNNNGATISANDTLTISAATDIVNTGSQIESAKNIALSSRHLTNSDNALIRANDSITVDWTGALNNVDSKLVAKNNIETTQNIDGLPNIRSGSLTNTSLGLIRAQNGTLGLTLGILNNQGAIGANQVALNADYIGNTGDMALILANTHLDVRSTSNMDNLDGGALFSFGSGYLQANSTLTNRSASIESATTLTLDANQIFNKKSVIEHSISKADSSPVNSNSNWSDKNDRRFVYKTHTDTVNTPYISKNSTDGFILSSGDIDITGDIENVYSTISAVGNLTVFGSIYNRSYTAIQQTIRNGSTRTVVDHRSCRHSAFGKCRKYHSWKTRSDTTQKYSTVIASNSVNLAPAKFTAGGKITVNGVTTANVGSANSSDLKKTKSIENAGSAASVDITGTLSNTVPDVKATNQDIIKARRDAIFNENIVEDLISSALFSGDSPNPNYLIETNPLLTSYDSFISSDYLLNKTVGDSAGRSGKITARLGDGYLEQRLVREQILSYTGYQTLPDSVDMESTYSTLMSNAIDVYDDLNLKTGVELSKEQIAKLKQPIVWMVEETVQTASGPQQALVPKVYFSDASGLELRPDGALIAANSIHIESEGGISNSGAMLAKVDLSLKGKSVNSSGTMSTGGSINLLAVDDITNHGSIEARGALNLNAGGNINSETKASAGDRAELKGNNISLSAGNNITLKGSDVEASEQVFVNAGNNFSLASLEVLKETSDYKAAGTSTETTTTNQVSTLSGNNIQLKAGNNLTSQGAQINASGNLALAANDIDLLAVKDTKDAYSFLGGDGNSTEKRTHNEALTVTTLGAGGTLSLVSQQDILSQGSTLSGDEGIALAAGGDVILTTAQANNSSFEEVKKKKSGFFGSKKSTKTTTSESLTNQGTSMTSGGDIQMVSGADILLSGTKAKAAGSIGLQAVGDIQLLSAVDQTSSRYQEQKKGTFKVKAKDQGSIKQTAVTSDLIANGTSGEGNIALTSGRNITLEGATLAANDTLSMGAGSGSLQAVTQNADGNYVSANGAQVGNVTVGSKALQSSEWSESSSGFRGIFKDLAKGLAVVAAVSTGGLVHGDIKVGEADATRTDSLKQQTATLAANDLDINAQNNLALIGTNVDVSNTANLSANDIIIDAAHEQTVVSNSHTEQTVSAKGATLQKDQISLASITETDQTERTTTTSNTWAGSSISAGNLSIKANNNVAIVASDVNVTNDASIKGNNVLVGGREATTETTHDSITKTKTLDIGVKNAYVDVALAAEALKDAKDTVSDAKNAYDDAKQKVAEGKLPASDLDFYKINLAAATANLASATTAVTSAGAAAAASTATYGFTVNGGMTTQTDTSSTSSTQGIWNASNINIGNNANVASENNLNVEGSNINTAGQLALNAQNINITAGKNTYTESTESHSDGASASYGLSGGFSGGINASQSRSDSQSVTHSNSQIGAGSLVSNSDNLTIEGGNLNATDIDITTDKLLVTSLQDTTTSSSKSTGGSVGFGSSKNVGINASQSNADSAWVNQQSGITGGTVNITAKDTSLTGGVIAAVDEQGNSTDQLNLTTDTLTVADLQDFDNSQSMGMSISGSSNTTTVGANFNGHEKEQTTKATIGLGNVTVGGLSIEESIDEQAQFADLNRDAANSQEITKDMERGGLDMSLTVDNRMLTKEGRKAIANDFEDTYEHGQDIGRVAKAISDNEDLGILNFGEALDHNAKGTQLKNDLLRNPENAKILAGLQSEDPDVHNKAMQDLGHLAQEKFGLTLSEINLYDGKKTSSSSLADTQLVDVKGGVVVDANSAEAGKMYLDVNGESKTSQIDTLGHEVLETQDYQGKGRGLVFKNTENQQEALGDAFGAQLADRINQAAGGDLNNTGGANFNQRQLASNSVAQGTYNANKVGNATVDHRQLYVAEAQAILKAAPAYAKQHGITENEAKTQLTQQALRQVDQTWSEQIEENPQAREMLANVASEIGQVSESPIGRGNLDVLLDTDTSKAFETKDEATFKDTNINARETTLIEQGFVGEAGFIEKYGTQNGEKAVDIGLGEAAGQASKAIKDGVAAVVEGIQQDPIGLAKSVAEGVLDSTVNAVTSPMETFVYEDSKGSAADRQLVAELQGNAEAAKKEAGSNLIDTVSELTPPGVAKAVKKSAEVVAEEAVEVAGKQAAKKIDFVDTDGEMIGQNGPTYTGVIDQSKASDQLENTANVPTYLFRKDSRGEEIYEQGGFIAKSPDSPVLLESYVDFGIDSKYIGTTKYKEVAEKFNIEGISSNTKEGYVHVIDKDSLKSTQRDVNLEIPSNPNYEEFEIAVENEIPSCSIIGCYKVDESGEQIGNFIRNPEYE